MDKYKQDNKQKQKCYETEYDVPNKRNEVIDIFKKEREKERKETNDKSVEIHMFINGIKQQKIAIHVL